ncbi:MAG: SDR family oxidoreductase [bacterium]|nr:SDR family oxidoreductase [bacterium]
MANLSGRFALVTGASRGIGEACAYALADAGATVLVNSRENDEAAQKVVATISASGGTSELLLFNVADSAQVKQAFAQIGEQHGKLHILVNNAGKRVDGLALRMTDEQWRDALGVNLDGVFFCCREALGLMRAEGGSIVNISSVAAFAGSAGQANYSAAKAGVMGLTRSLALEYGGRNIRVNAVVPGIIETAMTSSIKENLREQMLAQIPVKRFGRPEEVANAVLFLASDAASYISGATLHVNGGGYPA